MNESSDLPDLPAALLDAVFHVLYGPEERCTEELAALQARHREHADAIAAHVAWARRTDMEARATQSSAGDRPRRRNWSLAPGTWFGDFRIVEPLGSGGMGSVFAATRRVDGERVALKVLHPDVLSRPEARLRFEREARALTEIRHPSLCEPLGHGEIEGCPFLVMRLVPGPTLAERIAIARRGDDAHTGLLPAEIVTALTGEATTRLPAATDAMLRIVEQLASALQAAHDRGVLHRDVKPGNVLLTPDGRAVLVDFGLATVDTAATLTATGDLLGTPAYMAPEQIQRHRDELDARVDVYALGALLYECLTSRPPFTGDSHAALLAAIEAGDHTPLGEVRPDLPADLATVLATALATERERRYGSAAEFGADLARVRLGERVRARRIAPWRLLHAWIARNRTTAALAATLALAAGSLAALAAVVRAEQRRTDLLASAAVVAMAQADEAAAWPATAHSAARLRSWLADHANPDRADSLPARLAALEAVCGVTGSSMLQLDAAREHEAQRRRLDEEIRALTPWVPSTAPGAVPADVAVEFRSRRLEWLRHERDSLAPPAPQAELPPELAPHREALLTVARYLLDGGITPERPGAITRVRSALAWLDARRPEAHATAWQRVRATLARGEEPYRTPIELDDHDDLVPIGPDPQSRLEEFAVLRSGAVPERDADGELRLDEHSAIVLVLLPRGRTVLGTLQVRLGSDALAFPPSPVQLEPYFLGKHEISQGQWLRLGGGRPSRFAAGTTRLGASFSDRHPVEGVDSAQAREVLGWHGLGLPTEAQWEFAARAGNSRPPSLHAGPAAAADNTANLPHHEPYPPFSAHDRCDGHVLTTPIGALAANAFGLHDLGGNVSEWCDDVFGPYWLPQRSGDGRRLTTWGDRGVIRGASFALHARPHHRLPVPPDLRLPVLGVRAARRL